MTSMHLTRLARCSAGGPLIEFALALPLALLLLVGGVELGRGMMQYLTVDKTMRDATRYLARVPEAALAGWGLDNARNLALTGTIDGSGGYLVSHWTSPQSVVLQQSSAPVLRIRLTASVPFQFALLPIIGLPKQMTFTVIHEERHIGE